MFEACDEKKEAERSVLGSAGSTQFVSRLLPSELQEAEDELGRLGAIVALNRSRLAAGKLGHGEHANSPRTR